MVGTDFQTNDRPLAIGPAPAWADHGANGDSHQVTMLYACHTAGREVGTF